MKVAQLSGIACYLPKDRLGNDELVRVFPSWTEEKIVRKLGIRTRPIAASDETAVDMAVQAGKRLLQSNLCTPEEVDFLVLCTQSPDYFLPTSACLVQERLGLSTRCAAFDINLGCSGFVYGLAICKGLIESGLAHKVLFITSETYSKYINKQDRTSRPLFGDGAAATLLIAADTDSSDSEEFIGPVELGTDGKGADMLIVPAGAQRLPASRQTAIVHPDGRGSVRSQNELFMHGPGIFSFTIDVIPPLVERIQKKCRERNVEIDSYIFHQANRFMLDRLQDLCNIDKSKYFNNMMERGNTVSSSIPIAIVDAMKTEFVHPGDRSLLVGFGVGLSWGAILVHFPENFVALSDDDFPEE